MSTIAEAFQALIDAHSVETEVKFFKFDEDADPAGKQVCVEGGDVKVEGEYQIGGYLKPKHEIAIFPFLIVKEADNNSVGVGLNGTTILKVKS